MVMVTSVVMCMALAMVVTLMVQLIELLLQLALDWGNVIVKEATCYMWQT
jgi:hypothetical protein